MRSTTFNGELIVRATQVDVPLPTGYLIPKAVMQAALDAYTTEYVKQNRAFGELNPDLHMYDHHGTIQLSEVSHAVTGYNWWHETSDGSTTLYVHIKPLDTPKGRVLKALLDSEVPVHASYRAEGSVTNATANPDFRLISFDITPENVPTVDGVFRHDEFGRRV